MCMGGRHGRGPEETEELRRQVRELREEVDRLKAVRDDHPQERGAHEPDRPGAIDAIRPGISECCRLANVLS